MKYYNRSAKGFVIVFNLKKMETKVIELKKYTENGHIVILEGIGNWSCNCKGFSFNGECSHIQKQKEKQIFYKEKEQLKRDVENRIKNFIYEYQMIPKITVTKSGNVSVKFIFE